MNGCLCDLTSWPSIMVSYRKAELRDFTKGYIVTPQVYRGALCLTGGRHVLWNESWCYLFKVEFPGKGKLLVLSQKRGQLPVKSLKQEHIQTESELKAPKAYMFFLSSSTSSPPPPLFALPLPPRGVFGPLADASVLRGSAVSGWDEVLASARCSLTGWSCCFVHAAVRQFIINYF